MELSDEITPQHEYEQLMEIMNKKDWIELRENIHRPEILEVIVVYANAMTQRKQAQIQLTETHRCSRSWYLKPRHILDVEQTDLSNCVSHNAVIEQEQLKILTRMLYGKEYTYDELHDKRLLKYLFE
jgi:endonuclease III-like uncharacterized protein